MPRDSADPNHLSGEYIRLQNVGTPRKEQSLQKIRLGGNQWRNFQPDVDLCLRLRLREAWAQLATGLASSFSPRSSFSTCPRSSVVVLDLWPAESASVRIRTTGRGVVDIKERTFVAHLERCQCSGEGRAQDEVACQLPGWKAVHLRPAAKFSSGDEGPVCSGRGTCTCGLCRCQNSKKGKIYGRFLIHPAFSLLMWSTSFFSYCECDDFSCPLRFEKLGTVEHSIIVASHSW